MVLVFPTVSPWWFKKKRMGETLQLYSVSLYPVIIKCQFYLISKWDQPPVRRGGGAVTTTDWLVFCSLSADIVNCRSVERFYFLSPQTWLFNWITRGAFERHPWAHSRCTESERLPVGGLRFRSLHVLPYPDLPGVATIVLRRNVGSRSWWRARARWSRPRWQLLRLIEVGAIDWLGGRVSDDVGRVVRYVPSHINKGKYFSYIISFLYSLVSEASVLLLVEGLLKECALHCE